MAMIIANETGNSGSMYTPDITLVESNITDEDCDFEVGSDWEEYEYCPDFYYEVASEVKEKMFPFPTASYSTDAFWDDLGWMMFAFILIQFISPINVIVSVLVNEKADKITEGLKMMGATLASYWVSYLCFRLHVFELMLFLFFYFIYFL